LTPSAALAFLTTYTATVSGAKDTAGDSMSGSVTWSFTTAAAATPPPAGGTMVLQNFNGPTVPKNAGSDTYPSVYTGDGSAGTASLTSSNAITANTLQANITVKGLYLQFNPYDSTGRSFASYYANNDSTGGLSLAPGWQYNTYNRLSFWIRRPTNASPLDTGGDQNVQVGTYVKQITNADTNSAEAGGNHYYHLINLPNNGQWTLVILNMPPDHH